MANVPWLADPATILIQVHTVAVAKLPPARLTTHPLALSEIANTRAPFATATKLLMFYLIPEGDGLLQRFKQVIPMEEALMEHLLTLSHFWFGPRCAVTFCWHCCRAGPVVAALRVAVWSTFLTKVRS